MRRLLVPILVVPLALAAAPARAGCDPETGECHAVDCIAWDPVNGARETLDRAAAGDPHVVDPLLPPACPP